VGVSTDKNNFPLLVSRTSEREQGCFICKTKSAQNQAVRSPSRSTSKTTVVIRFSPSGSRNLTMPPTGCFTPENEEYFISDTNRALKKEQKGGGLTVAASGITAANSVPYDFGSFRSRLRTRQETEPIPTASEADPSACGFYPSNSRLRERNSRRRNHRFRCRTLRERTREPKVPSPRASAIGPTQSGITIRKCAAENDSNGNSPHNRSSFFEKVAGNALNGNSRFVRPKSGALRTSAWTKRLI